MLPNVSLKVGLADNALVYGPIASQNSLKVLVGDCIFGGFSSKDVKYILSAAVSTCQRHWVCCKAVQGDAAPGMAHRWVSGSAESLYFRCELGGDCCQMCVSLC